MSAIKNPAGSFYLDTEDFEIEHQQTPTGRRPVVSLKEVPFEIPDLSDKYISTNLKGQPNGVAELDEGGKLMANQLPSGIDKAEEYGTREGFPEVGQANIIYIDLSTNLEYRWSGSTYVQIPTGLAIGNTPETAFRGDHGEAIYNATINGHPVRSSPTLTAHDIGVDTPEYITMVVTALKEGAGNYKADKTSSQIRHHVNGGGYVYLRYTDDQTHTDEVYAYETYDNDKGAIFRRLNVSKDSVDRMNIIVDYAGNVTPLHDTFNGKSLGLDTAKPEQVPVVEEVDENGVPTKWKSVNFIKIDDTSLSHNTIMSSLETARRLSCTKELYGERVTMYPVEGYPLDIIAEIHAVQNGDGVPSVKNEKPISGWDNIVVSIDNTQIDGRKDYNQQFHETIYGGTYEPNRGRLKITMGYRSFNGSEAWEKIDRTINGRKTIFKLNVPGLGSSMNTMGQMCNIFKTGPLAEPFDSDCVWTAGDDVYVGNGIVAEYGEDLNRFKTQLGQTNMQIVYELAQEKEEIVEQKRIVAIEGKNIISASTGDVRVIAQTVGCSEEEINEAVGNYLRSPEGMELIKFIISNQG